MKKIANYLGHDYTDDQIKSVLRFCSLENMRSSSSYEYLKNEHAFEKGFDFFRKAQIGNWKEYFDDEISKRLDRAVEKNLKYKTEPFNYGD